MDPAMFIIGHDLDSRHRSFVEKSKYNLGRRAVRCHTIPKDYPIHILGKIKTLRSMLYDDYSLLG